jgi:hypothetical protein
LLYDLEKLSKRKELNNERSQRLGVPKFNKDFYNEIKQPPSEWSDEFKNFLGSYSQLRSDGHFIEKISSHYPEIKLFFSLFSPIYYNII